MHAPAGRFGVVLALTVLFLAACALAGPKAAKNPKLGDTRVYLEAVSQAKDLAVDEQLDFWRKFLDQNPNTSFRDEIESNIKHLDELLTETNPVRKREQKDSDRYLRAVEFSKKLSAQDQIELWQQYLEENPGSLYRKEIVQKLEDLRAQQGLGKPTVTPQTKTDRTSSPAVLPVAGPPPIKDSQKALLLAMGPGIVVPGMGHWYTEDYALAGILTGVRAAGIALGLPGIIQRNHSLIIAGAVIAGFSYLLDVADAPFSAQRYNDEHEPKPVKTGTISGAGVECTVSFNF